MSNARCCQTHEGPHLHGCVLDGDHDGACRIPTPRAVAQLRKPVTAQRLLAVALNSHYLIGTNRKVKAQALRLADALAGVELEQRQVHALAWTLGGHRGDLFASILEDARAIPTNNVAGWTPPL
jgi:hypothetical protein